MLFNTFTSLWILAHIIVLSVCAFRHLVLRQRLNDRVMYYVMFAPLLSLVTLMWANNVWSFWP